MPVDHDVSGRVLLDRTPDVGVDRIDRAAGGPWNSLLGFRGRRARQEIGRDARVLPARENPMLLVDCLEELALARDAFRLAEAQIAAWPQRIVKRLHQPILQVGLEVDQQIAAGDQIEFREGRILGDAVSGEDAHLADFPHRTALLAVLGEPALDALARDAFELLRIARRARDRHCSIVDVGAENLHSRRQSCPLQAFLDQNGDRVNLLAGRARRHPDPDLGVRALVRDHFRYDRRFERLECMRIAEELRDADQELVKQQIDLARFLAQPLDECGHGVDPQHLHASLNPPNQSVVLVLAEVMPGPRTEQGADRGKVRRHIPTRAVAILLRGNLAQVLVVVHEQRRHLRHGDDVVDQSGRRRALGHAAHRRSVGIPLGQRQAAVFLHLSQSEGAVTAGSGQDDTHGKLTLIFGERGKESVDRPSMLARRSGLRDLQRSGPDGQGRIGRNDENAVRRHPLAVGRFDYCHFSVCPQQVHQQALVIGVQMLHQHEGDAGVGRHVIEERLERLEPAGGSTDTDDQAGGFPSCRFSSRRLLRRRFAPASAPVRL